MKGNRLDIRLVAFVCLLAVAALFAACADSRAVLSEIKLCEEPANGSCDADQTIFSADTDRIVVTGVVSGIPKTGALVTTAWIYFGNGEPEEIHSLTLPATEEGAQFSFFIEETEQWRPGNYEVVLSTGEQGSESEQGRKQFTIE